MDNKTNIFFLESSIGVDGVAVYSATWNIVDPISILGSGEFGLGRSFRCWLRFGGLNGSVEDA